MVSEKNTIWEVMAVPRARSPDSIEAEKLYKSGMALVDIAKKLGKPEGTVRRWKSTQKWDENSKKKTRRTFAKEKRFRKSERSQTRRTARKSELQGKAEC